MRLEQVAEAAHRRLVRHRLAAKIDRDKAAHRRRIVQRLLHHRARQIEPVLQKQIEPVLQKIDAHHCSWLLQRFLRCESVRGNI